MSFAAPLFLAATLAAVLPLLLHLIHRQKAKEVPFPTLRFLEISVQKTRKRKYIDDLALLLLRMGALIFLAFGLARPALSSLSNLFGRGAGTAAVIVIDTSGSMTAVDESGPRFDAAREQAGRILDTLSPETDRVALLATGGPPDASASQLTRAFGPVRQQLAALRPYPQRADLAAAIDRAQALLDASDASDASDAGRRELYVVTDNQALNYDDLPDASASAGKTPATSPDSKALDTPLFIVDVAGSPQIDVALTDLAVTSPAPLSGIPVAVRVTLANPSGIAQIRTVELRLDDQPLAVSPAISIPPGRTTTHDFQLTADTPGVHRGEVRLVEPDAAAFNNALAFALVTDPPIPIAVLKPRRHEIPQSDAAFYLERALAPGSASADGAASGLHITTVTPDELSRTPLAGQAVVFCVDLPALDATQADPLAAYVKAGGHLFWIAGPNVSAAAYNAMDDRAGGVLLPSAVGDLRTPPPDLAAGGWSIARLDPTHPALASLVEPPSLYRSVLVFRHWPIRPGGGLDGPSSPPRVLAALDDGQPLLVERNIGQAGGSTLWLGTSLRPDATNLPLKAIYLPLISRLTFQLAGASADQARAVVGTPLTIPLPAAPGPVEIVRPSGETVRRSPEPPNAPTFTLSDTFDPGVYLLKTTTSQPPRTLAFALNPDPAESLKSAPIAPETLRKRFPARRPVEIVTSPDALTPTIRRLREGTPLRDPLLALVLAALVAESFLANRKRALPAADAPASTVATAPPGRPQPPAPASPPVPATGQVVTDDGQVLRFD
jgi:hypothetical protein